MVIVRSLSNIPALSQAMVWCFGVHGAIAAILVSYFAHHNRKRHRALDLALKSVNATNQVAELIRTLELPETRINSTTKRLLTRLLPCLKASDAPKLSDRERDILLRHIATPPTDKGYYSLNELFSADAYKRELDFRLAILKAYEQIGGERELESVEHAAKGDWVTMYSFCAVPAEMRTAAEQCLPFLRARASEQRAAEQLLRPSSYSPAGRDLLLRPARAAADDADELLLRPVDASDSAT